MTKSATGTEYVNAQAANLRLEIDDLASKIEGSPQTETDGLVYNKIFVGKYAYVSVALIIEVQQTRTKCTLRFYFAQWNGSETYQGDTVAYYGSLNVDKKKEIPAAFRPIEKLSHSGQMRSWTPQPPYSGNYNLEVYTDGRLHVVLNGSGREYYIMTYYI